MNKSVYALGSALFGLAAFSSTPASAIDCGPNASSDSNGVWECLEAREIATGNYVDLSDGNWHGPFHFHGEAELSHDIIGNIAGCTLHVHGNVRLLNGTVDIQVVDAWSAGGGNCTNVTFDGFPWTASVPGNGAPGDVYPADTGTTSGVLGTVQIRYPLFLANPVICEDDVTVVFGNDNSGTTGKSGDSYFEFNNQTLDGIFGDCHVNGRVVIDLHHDDEDNVYDDVNAW